MCAKTGENVRDCKREDSHLWLGVLSFAIPLLISISCSLQREEVSIEALLLHQALMAPLLTNAPVFEHQNAISHAHRGETMGDQQGRGASGHLPELRKDLGFRFGIDGG